MTHLKKMPKIVKNSKPGASGTRARVRNAPKSRQNRQGGANVHASAPSGGVNQIAPHDGEKRLISETVCSNNPWTTNVFENRNLPRVEVYPGQKHIYIWDDFNYWHGEVEWETHPIE